MQAEDDAIIFSPIKHKARVGWDVAFKKMRANGEDTQLMPDHVDEEQNWQW